MLRETTDLAILAEESYEDAQKLAASSENSFAHVLAPSNCQGRTASAKEEIIHGKHCAKVDRDPVAAKEMMMHSLHFVAIDVYQALEYEHVVIDAVGQEVALMSQTTSFSFSSFNGALEQLPHNSLWSIWTTICTFSPELTRNGTCLCIQNKLYHERCNDRALLRSHILNAYSQETSKTTAETEVQGLVVVLDVYYLLSRSKHGLKQQTDTMITELSNLCQLIKSKTFQSRALEDARAAAAQTICALETEHASWNMTKRANEPESSFMSFADFIQQTSDLGQNVRAATDGSMNSVFAIVLG